MKKCEEGRGIFFVYYMKKCMEGSQLLDGQNYEALKKKLANIDFSE